jgi:dTDP-4-dehydrorhamnose 3,5-epimerase
MTGVRETTAGGAVSASGPTADWSLVGPKDRQLVGPDWAPTNPIRIEGVVAKHIMNVLAADGYLTEIWRSEWELDGLGVGQVFQRVIDPGCASGWHAHGLTTDRLFCSSGRIHLGLYDGRRSSSSHRNVADFWFGSEWPAVVVVPPGVWHAVRNVGTSPAVYVNVVDVAYDYVDPDHYRLPLDTPLIPISV